ncbi:IF-2B-domain-containing protein [Patellaria atrata CBS 101060]|uniref:Translation initiation factor eIF2B subunit delta n=1 Tax=Patellaria atrata CBS 101060 TaxID=1346257 RepID=A0A9P4S2G5_9PEZI|nr:IF-2B-domain-containing protein [Patellaria atrata CBS 101060]
MMSNGRLYSRVGTAIVAMLAHERDVPVIVCCEALKMTDRVALDSIVVNEVAPADELLDFTSQFGGREIGVVEKEEEGEEGMTQREKLVKRWVNTPRLQMLNLLYDVTPAEYIRMIVSEYGSLPPSSVPVVYRISTGVQ